MPRGTMACGRLRRLFDALTASLTGSFFFIFVQAMGEEMICAAKSTNN
jgi:hypothetical protein